MICDMKKNWRTYAGALIEDLLEFVCVIRTMHFPFLFVVALFKVSELLQFTVGAFGKYGNESNSFGELMTVAIVGSNYFFSSTVWFTVYGVAMAFGVWQLITGRWNCNWQLNGCASKIFVNFISVWCIRCERQLFDKITGHAIRVNREAICVWLKFQPRCLTQC